MDHTFFVGDRKLNSITSDTMEQTKFFLLGGPRMCPLFHGQQVDFSVFGLDMQVRPTNSIICDGQATTSTSSPPTSSPTTTSQASEASTSTTTTTSTTSTMTTTPETSPTTTTTTLMSSLGCHSSISYIYFQPNKRIKWQLL